MDYQTVSGNVTNQTFQADTLTMSASLTLFWTEHLEGGTVINTTPTGQSTFHQ